MIVNETTINQSPTKTPEYIFLNCDTHKEFVKVTDVFKRLRLLPFYMTAVKHRNIR